MAKSEGRKLPKIKTAVFPWYHEEDYGRLLCTCSDSYLFPRSYEEWRNVAEDALSDMRAQGINAVKVFVDSNDFFGWCRQAGIAPDGAARQKYAEQLAKAEGVNGLVVVDTVYAVAA
jgi:hypothetical protein